MQSSMLEVKVNCLLVLSKKESTEKKFTYNLFYSCVDHGKDGEVVGMPVC